MQIVNCSNKFLVIKMGLGSPENATGVNASVTATFNEMSKVFGYPQKGFSGKGTIKAQWFGWINGLQYSIDDFGSDKTAHANTNWILHGEHLVVAKLVYLALKTLTGRKQ